MIEDKFGAELLGLQLPVSSLGRLPPLRADDSSLPSSCAAAQVPYILLSSPSSPSRAGEALGLGLAAQTLSPGGPAAGQGGAPSGTRQVLCSAPPTLPSSHTFPPLPSPASGPAEVLSSSPKLEPPPSPHSNRKKHRRKKSTGTPRPDGPSSAAEG